MNDENPFPHDLLQLQERLHRAHAEHRAYLDGLPWSVEPMKGWVRGERFSHRGDVPHSPGWSDEQKETVDGMWAEIRELSIAVVDHRHWKSVPVDTLVKTRRELKRQARPAEVAEAA
ncbi:hypothetical protein ACFW9N_38435 [Streptomyces sp. NPDC059496]|uniref:hypothetical protein n=1 Tax=Streptomyces sp. NPDC059496 TaxID=3346851 RepID=UPI0036A987AE